MSLVLEESASSGSAAARSAPTPARTLWLVAMGAMVAFVSSNCGIGGGLFVVPFLHYAVGFTLELAVATSLVHVLAATTAATVTEALAPHSFLRLDLAAVLAAGALLGAQLGYRLSRRIDTLTLRKLFVVVMFLAGVRMLFDGADASDAGATGFTIWDVALGFAIGAGGGFISPLLGIGGGLFMVPALFAFVPGLDFAAARACSMAASAVASARGAWLHSRAGSIDRRVGGWLALGAVIGAVAAVYVFHLPGFVDTGRWVLAGVLWFVAARFLWDFRRSAGRA